MPSILTLAGTALAAYWPFVLMTLISRARDFPLGHKAMAGSSVMFQPYLNVIRMHILIFVFAGLQFAHLAHFALFPILLFYFFPWRVFNRERKGLASEAARAQSDR